MGKRLVKLMLGVSLCMSSSLLIFASNTGMEFPGEMMKLHPANVMINKVDVLTKQDKKQQIDNFKLAIDQKTEKEEEKKKYEIVSPKFVLDSNIKSEPEILVSVRFLENLDANMTIIRFIEPRSIVFSDESKKEIAEVLKNAPLYVGEDVKSSKSGIYDAVGEATIEDISEYKDIYELYDKTGKDLLLANEKYRLLYMQTLEKYKLEARDLNRYIRNRVLKIKGYHDLYQARTEFEIAAQNYLKSKEMYESYHRDVILDGENMVIEGALPYYNYVLEAPQYGRYEVIIKDNESDELLGPVFEFHIKADEKIKQDLLENVDKNLKKGILGY